MDGLLVKGRNGSTMEPSGVGLQIFATLHAQHCGLDFQKRQHRKKDAETQLMQ